MNKQEMSIVEQAAEVIRAAVTIPCTACRYCVDDCPMKIAIPDYFAIYNNLKRFGARQGMVAGNLLWKSGTDAWQSFGLSEMRKM
ncbi:MAG: hypothetical protein LUC94_15240 [Clostridiales bacterium]|nr:hypothetical protein [Clostridiales bacterium]